MRSLACLDGDLKSGVSVADLILIMGLIVFWNIRRVWHQCIGCIGVHSLNTVDIHLVFFLC
ncbi:MAG: hypothetical protein CSA25_06550 [Desulfobacter postgatei]|uniref:Uncharacterized protein n=1 Tax=Desulfobacter postgatei TaxID=2293 RepID=A0A2G6MQ75_9BACT|nr:MAG: hypothetical protein CSA25_06550 [Desulfobacter postgatei]